MTKPFDHFEFWFLLFQESSFCRDWALEHDAAGPAGIWWHLLACYVLRRVLVLLCSQLSLLLPLSVQKCLVFLTIVHHRSFNENCMKLFDIFRYFRVLGFNSQPMRGLRNNVALSDSPPPASTAFWCAIGINRKQRGLHCTSLSLFSYQVAIQKESILQRIASCYSNLAQCSPNVWSSPAVTRQNILKTNFKCS